MIHDLVHPISKWGIGESFRQIREATVRVVNTRGARGTCTERNLNLAPAVFLAIRSRFNIIRSILNEAGVH